MSSPPWADIQERLSGSIERVTFHSEESGFCVHRVKVKGKWVNDRNYDREPSTVFRHG